jgi:DNA-binding transcriptional regulator YiaG
MPKKKPKRKRARPFDHRKLPHFRAPLKAAKEQENGSAPLSACLCAGGFVTIPAMAKKFAVPLSEYALMLHSSGLSHHEAAKFHNVRTDTLKSWLSGQQTVPQDQRTKLYRLIDLQTHAADWLLRTLRKKPPEAVRICISDNEYEAGIRGWPTASVMNTAVRRFLEMADPELRSRVTLIYNPETPEERSNTWFVSPALREDGSFDDPDNPETSDDSE